MSIRESTVCVDEGGCFRKWVERRVGKQLVGQRLDARFTRDHGLGAAFYFVGQVNVFEVLFGGHSFYRSAQFGRQFALVKNACKNNSPALFQLTQIAQAGFQFTQLNVVQLARHFLAVARNKGDGGSAVQQLDRSVHLGRSDLEFGGNLQENFVQNERAQKEKSKRKNMTEGR